MNSAFLNDLFSLDGRVALVTGASGGIGRALARGLAMAGARVALTGRSVEMLAATQRDIADQGGDSAVFPADLGELAAVGALVESALGQFGQVDILVNCAGVNKREPIADVSPDTYEKIMDVNLRAAYFLSQAVLPSMRARGGGKIINIGSINTTFGLGTVSVYGMAKAGLAQMTRVMAVEWAAHNIQVNCLSPGFVETELTAPLWADEHRRTWVLDRVPLKRPGVPDDLVGMTIYLAARASDFTTGQTLYVDGGFLAGGQW